MRDDFDNRRDEFDAKLPERDYKDHVDDHHHSPEGVELDQLDSKKKKEDDDNEEDVQ